MTLGLRHLAISFLGGCIALSSGGCHSADPSSTAATKPAWEQEGLNEREREVSRVGIFGGLTLRVSNFFDDIADKISGAPTRYAHLMADSNNPENRRQGITGLADRPWGETAIYTVAYARIAEDTQQDPLVRATAIRSLNRSREKRFAPLFIKDLADPSVLVRLEACKALNRMPNAEAVPDLLKMIPRPEEDKDVRIAAAEALRHYKLLSVARALASLLNERDFGIVWQAHRSLRDVTRKDLGYSEAAWLDYFTKGDPSLK